ncbi:MAG: type 4a pilus biogenesis protein PilO [Kofleriaceae bacterium]|nr:type 4a pilus biogenesis protein PilO [Kofleriaceae bacterium]
MAKESPIATLAAKPIQTQIMVLCGILVVLGGLFYQMSYSAGEEELEQSVRSYKNLEKAQNDLKIREKEWKELLKAKKDLDLTINTNQVSLPKDADLNSFIDHLQGQAAVAGVSFKSWKRNDEVSAGAYVKVPIAVEVVGNFHQVLKYFFLLGEKETTKRIITVEDFSMVPEKSGGPDEILLKASFRATAFRQADGAKTFVAKKEVKKKAPKKKSGIDKVKEAREKRETQVKDAVDKKVQPAKAAPTTSGTPKPVPTSPSELEGSNNTGSQL